MEELPCTDFGSLPEAFTKSATDFIKKLKAKDTREIFHEPVPDDLVPEYRKIVAHPMDLSTLESNLTNGRYQTPRDFKRDLDLIWSNCFLFNPSKTVFYQVGKVLQKWSSSAFREILRKHNITIDGRPKQNENTLRLGEESAQGHHNIGKHKRKISQLKMGSNLGTPGVDPKRKNIEENGKSERRRKVRTNKPLDPDTVEEFVKAFKPKNTQALDKETLKASEMEIFTSTFHKDIECYLRDSLNDELRSESGEPDEKNIPLLWGVKSLCESSTKRASILLEQFLQKGSISYPDIENKHWSSQKSETKNGEVMSCQEILQNNYHSIRSIQQIRLLKERNKETGAYEQLQRSERSEIDSLHKGLMNTVLLFKPRALVTASESVKCAQTFLENSIKTTH